MMHLKFLVLKLKQLMLLMESKEIWYMFWMISLLTDSLLVLLINLFWFLFFILFRELNTTYLDKLGVKMMKGYADPYHGRQVLWLIYSCVTMLIPLCEQDMWAVILCYKAYVCLTQYPIRSCQCNKEE